MTENWFPRNQTQVILKHHKYAIQNHESLIQLGLSHKFKIIEVGMMFAKYNNLLL